MPSTLTRPNRRPTRCYTYNLVIHARRAPKFTTIETARPEPDNGPPFFAGHSGVYLDGKNEQYPYRTVMKCFFCGDHHRFREPGNQRVPCLAKGYMHYTRHAKGLD